MLEMYIQGVSTRKVYKIIENLCGKNYFKSFVSTLTKNLDKEVKLWCNRDLINLSYSYLLADLTYIKVRENHRVISKACHIAIGINENGQREVVGFKISEGEREDTWSLFFKLRERIKRS